MSAVLVVAIDAPLRRLFDYRAPPQVAPESLAPGVRVWVPFGRRRVVGVLVETRASSDVPDSKLRTAIAVVDDEPVFDARLLELLRWAADYYRHPPGEVIAAALPAPLRTGDSMLETSERWTLSAAARTGSLAGAADPREPAARGGGIPRGARRRGRRGPRHAVAALARARARAREARLGDEVPHGRPAAAAPGCACSRGPGADR